ncbi:dipicolinate synthase subunit B [Oscillospiraceae bacterium OttesenSCG-928-F05]|nr:dipicolinate synthase subunit B [Oscillospiraceae bacterium OttesenSCG-928-F05]
MEKIKVGFALTGSYCTFAQVIPQMRALKDLGYDIYPIFSESAAGTDTRFGRAEDFLWQAEDICGRKALTSVPETEPIGPKKLIDLLLVAPCTGNTLGKIAHGVTDSSVTMAAKAHLRNERPLVLAVSTNDALSGAAANIGALLNRRNLFFVPFGQDDPEKKPRSCVAKFERIAETVTAALENRQLQPLLV